MRLLWRPSVVRRSCPGLSSDCAQPVQGSATCQSSSCQERGPGGWSTWSLPEPGPHPNAQNSPPIAQALVWLSRRRSVVPGSPEMLKLKALLLQETSLPILAYDLSVFCLSSQSDLLGKEGTCQFVGGRERTLSLPPALLQTAQRPGPLQAFPQPTCPLLLSFLSLAPHLSCPSGSQVSLGQPLRHGLPSHLLPLWLFLPGSLSPAHPLNAEEPSTSWS